MRVILFALVIALVLVTAASVVLGVKILRLAASDEELGVAFRASLPVFQIGVTAIGALAVVVAVRRR